MATVVWKNLNHQSEAKDQSSNQPSAYTNQMRLKDSQESPDTLSGMVMLTVFVGMVKSLVSNLVSTALMFMIMAIHAKDVHQQEITTTCLRALVLVQRFTLDFC